jgi:chromosome segregation ATPase
VFCHPIGQGLLESIPFGIIFYYYGLDFIQSLKPLLMKKPIYAFAFSMMIAGAVLTSCESKEKKVEDAQEKVQDSKEELKEAQRELNAEYPSYRKDMEQRIIDNDKRIADLKAKLNEPGKKPLDNMRKDRIDELERKNADLRSRLYGYEKERGDWESFKREFNHDMDEMGNSINDLGKNNVK